MTKEEFIAAYCARSGVAWAELSPYRVALPCACGELMCEGWAMVGNDPMIIKSHNELYGPIHASDPS